jgi:hypothetical protein
MRVLNPVAVEAARWRWIEAMLALLAPPVGQHLMRQLPRSEDEVMDRILGKPSEKPTGPSPIKIHPPVRKCETQSHEDLFKTWSTLLTYCSMLCVCVIIIGDGQLVELCRAGRMHNPQTFKRLLIGNGPFHSHTHFSFTQNEAFWKVCLCRFAAWLCKNKQVYEVMKDLSHDNAKQSGQPGIEFGPPTLLTP